MCPASFSRIARLVSALLPFSSVSVFAQEPIVTPQQVVSAFEHNFGVHSGKRRNHSKGTCAIGEFIATPQAQNYSRSSLFSGQSLPVIARFSLPGGNPNVSDATKSARGLALEFSLPKGALHHMTMLNTPVFGAATPHTFYQHLLATQPDPITGKPDPDKIAAFHQSYPDSVAQAEFLAAHNPPISWANSSYYGIHTFKFINAKNETHLVRWQFIPEDGERNLSDDELTSLPTHFLTQRLTERLKQGPIQWTMQLTIGQSGDEENNPTIAWPSDRPTIKAGTLSITDIGNDSVCDKINFDPLVLSDGIAATDDPVLRFRSPAYAVSFGKRLTDR